MKQKYFEDLSKNGEETGSSPLDSSSCCGSQGRPPFCGGRYKGRTGSTRIDSDHEKNIQLNKIETFTHLKVKIPVKSGPN